MLLPENKISFMYTEMEGMPSQITVDYTNFPQKSHSLPEIDPFFTCHCIKPRKNTMGKIALTENSLIK